MAARGWGVIDLCGRRTDSPDKEGLLSLVIFLLLLTVLLNTAFQLSLKHGIMALRGISLQNMLHPRSIAQLLTSRYLLVSAALMASSMLLWLKVLSMTELSFAYPFQSLTLVLISVGSIIVLKERIGSRQWTGIALIMFGIFLISQS
jgi:drug/metabolite transporter (DMT)-like permease